MKKNTNSNSYTIIYASVMVIVVAFILAFTSAALRERQEKNERLDKMKQILTALRIQAKDNDEAEALFYEKIKKDQIINSTAEVLSEEGGFDIDVKKELAKSLEKRQLPLYLCDIDGETKYVLPLYGAGLWGAIWGYVALDDDKNTVYGVYFSHESETPGLGAEIADHHFQSKFQSKSLMKGDEIGLSVVKAGRVSDATYQVDGITGGTITSNGVDDMLKNCLSQYHDFLTAK